MVLSSELPSMKNNHSLRLLGCISIKGSTILHTPPNGQRK